MTNEEFYDKHLDNPFEFMRKHDLNTSKQVSVKALEEFSNMNIQEACIIISDLMDYVRINEKGFKEGRDFLNKHENDKRDL